MRKIVSILLAGISFSIATTSISYAESHANAVTFSLGTGYEYFSSKRHLENTSVQFLGLGYNFTNQWGIEGLLGTLNTDQKSSVGGRGVNGTMFNIDGIYHFTPYNVFEPYVLFGAGILGLNPNLNDANNEGSIDAGVGTFIFIDKVAAFRFEGRDMYTLVGGKNDVLLSGGLTFFMDLC